MKFIKYIALFLLLEGCNSNYEWGWYILNPSNVEGLTNLKFLISGITTTIYISVVSIFLAMIIGLVVALPSLSKNIVTAIVKSKTNKKTDKKALLYSCIKLEILSNIESLKKDNGLRQEIQLEMLTSKFNKSKNNELDNLDSLIIHFIENFSKSDSGAPEKTLWNRIKKTLEILVK